jgi:3-phosphoshikimate 1-carboxyvinyltransferase
MKKISGELYPPGDKSIAHRAALFSAISDYPQTFTNFPAGADCRATVECLNMLGVEAQIDADVLKVKGAGRNGLRAPDADLDAKNSGTTIRLISGILSAQSFPTTIAGDQHLNKRPMRRVMAPLREMGASIAAREENYPPLQFEPVSGLSSINYKLPVASAQVKSCVLLAGLYAKGETCVIEDVASRDHTERMLGLRTEDAGAGKKVFSSRATLIPDISMRIPGDISSAAFFIAAACMLPGSDLTVRNVSLNPTRTGLLQVLQSMGARIEVRPSEQVQAEPIGDIHVQYSRLHSLELSGPIIPNIIDEIPVLSIIATQSAGVFTIRDAGELRVKESDRIKAICSNLQRIGIDVEELEDGFRISGPQQIKGGNVLSYGDHRIAMAFGIAGLLTPEPVTIDQPDTAAVSFPEFWQELNRLTRD